MSFSAGGVPGTSPDVSEEMSPRSSGASAVIKGDDRCEALPVRCRFTGGMRRVSSCSGRAPKLASLSSVLTSSANSLEACEERGEAERESLIVKSLSMKNASELRNTASEFGDGKLDQP